MASHLAKTPKTHRKSAESHNGCSLVYSQRKEAVENSGRAVSGGQPYLTADDVPDQVLSRFHVFIRKTETCWLWTAGVDADGYGQLARPHRSPIKAHRLAWVLARGPIRSSQHVLHRCDVRNCVNPAHLFLGNQDANMKDAAAKGRLHTARPNMRRLSDEVVQAILGAPQFRGIVVQLAKRFGVSKAYVSALRSGARQRLPLGQPVLQVRGGLQPSGAGVLDGSNQALEVSDALRIGG